MRRARAIAGLPVGVAGDRRESRQLLQRTHQKPARNGDHPDCPLDLERIDQDVDLESAPVPRIRRRGRATRRDRLLHSARRSPRRARRRRRPDRSALAPRHGSPRAPSPSARQGSPPAAQTQQVGALSGRSVARAGASAHGVRPAAASVAAARGALHGAAPIRPSRPASAHGAGLAGAASEGAESADRGAECESRRPHRRTPRRRRARPWRRRCAVAATASSRRSAV
jgi:hypothetical protein